jgi:hypothetical protein
MRSFVIYTLYLTLLGLLNQEEVLQGNTVNTGEVGNAYNVRRTPSREDITVTTDLAGKYICKRVYGVGNLEKSLFIPLVLLINRGNNVI